MSKRWPAPTRPSPSGARIEWEFFNDYNEQLDRARAATVSEALEVLGSRWEDVYEEAWSRLLEHVRAVLALG